MFDSPRKIAEKIGIYAPFGKIIIHNLTVGGEAGRESRRRKRFLSQISSEIKIVLSRSLHQGKEVSPVRERQPDQVAGRYDYLIKVGQRNRCFIDPSITIKEIFSDPPASGQLLILGQPGVGKTITLFTIARELVSAAEEDVDCAIPAILDLTSWKRSMNIEDWIADSLTKKYGLSRDIAKQWLNEKKILPLLDSFDEVDPKYQEDCIKKINNFLSSSVQPEYVAICSRIESYEMLHEQLCLNEAICLYPPDKQSILSFLNETGNQSLGTLFEENKGEFDFLNVPLFLSMTILIAQHSNEGFLKDKFSGSPESLMSGFIASMLKRSDRPWQNKNKKKIAGENAVRWASILADRMRRNNISEFIIEDIGLVFGHEFKKPNGNFFRCIFLMIFLSVIGIISGYIDHSLGKVGFYRFPSVLLAISILLVPVILIPYITFKKVVLYGSIGFYERLNRIVVFTVFLIVYYIGLRLLDLDKLSHENFILDLFINDVYDRYPSSVSYKVAQGSCSGLFIGLGLYFVNERFINKVETIYISYEKIAVCIAVGLFVFPVAFTKEFLDCLLDASLSAIRTLSLAPIQELMLNPRSRVLTIGSLITEILLLLLIIPSAWQYLCSLRLSNLQALFLRLRHQLVAFRLSNSYSKRKILNSFFGNAFSFSGSTFLIISIILSFGPMTFTLLASFLLELKLLISHFWILISHGHQAFIDYTSQPELLEKLFCKESDSTAKDLLEIVYAFIAIGCIGGFIWSTAGPNLRRKEIRFANQGIWQSCKNSATYFAFGFIITYLLTILWNNPETALSNSIFVGFTSFLVPFINVFDHIASRLYLFSGGYIPWNLTKFLDYLNDRMLMQRIGGRYKFIHSLLQDYLTSIHRS